MVGGDRHEGPRGAVEREAVGGDRRGTGVTGGEAAQAERILNELEDAPVLVLHVRDVAALRIWRDDEQRYAKAEPIVVDVARRHVVVPSAPLVPHDHDRGRVPKRTLTDRIDDAGNPVRPCIMIRGSVIGVLKRRRDPGYGAEGSARDVREELRRRTDDVALPVTVPVDVVDRLVCRPD